MRYAIAARLLPYRRRADSRSEWNVAAAESGVPTASAPVGGHTKRCFDIAAAASTLLFLLPLFCLIALAIKLMDPGPVLFRHRRIGRHGVPFDCLKFRTMVVDGDQALRRHLATNRAAAMEWEAKQKLTEDPRITALGAILRKSSLDELPQLLNILKGEMSVVGPRPIVAAEMPKYGDCIAHYMRARPGLTGAWQVSGRTDIDYSSRVRLDRDYVESWAIQRDLLIIVKTVRVVVTARGSY
jgi:exopolysaccharide production protein ExoY